MLPKTGSVVCGRECAPVVRGICPRVSFGNLDALRRRRRSEAVAAPLSAPKGASALFEGCVLRGVISDLQQAIDDSSWGERNNLEAEANIGKLLAIWRDRNLPILHVKHDSTEPNSLYRPGQIGNNFKIVAQPETDEEVLKKSTNSAFIRTNLEQKLRKREIHEIVIVGVITNNSVEAIARMAGNLGFRTVVVSNATFTFGKYDYVGNWRTAEEVHNMPLANLSGEYAEIYSLSEVLALLPNKF